MPDRLTMRTKDLAQDNVEKIAALFPSCITESIDTNGKVVKAVDFEVLRMLLSNDIVDGNQERYTFTWPGKSDTIRFTNCPVNKTLRPFREESVNFETTHNLYIESDNFEALSLLRETYLCKIDMVYIDPPYNTGNDFVYKDAFVLDKDEYSILSGEIDDKGNRMVVNYRTDGRFHTNWLNMMYSRLLITRDLLKESGCIFISIDDHEVSNLRKICDEIFGEQNFIGELPTIMNLKGNNDQFCFAGTHEYTLAYCKNIGCFKPGAFADDEPEGWEKDEKGYFKEGATLKRTGEDAPRDKRPYGYFPILVDNLKNVTTVTEEEFSKIYDKNTKKFDDSWVEQLITNYSSKGFKVLLPENKSEKTSWRWGYEKVKKESDEIIVKDNYALYKKQRPELGELVTKKPKSLLYKPEYSSGNGTAEVKSLFNGKKAFSHPKPLELIKDLIHVGTNNNRNALILDYFSGSATTAHAVFELNFEDGGSRNFILVQLPEIITPETSISENSYEILTELGRPYNICEIAKERIRRAGEQLLDRNELYKGDIGFRVFKLDTSNMNDVFYNPQLLKKDLLHYLTNNVKIGRSFEDLLIQVMLEYGIELSVPINKKIVCGKEVFFVDNEYLIACFDDDVNEDVVTVIAKERPKHVVFRDSSMASDAVAINFEQIFKAYSPNTKIRVL